MVVRKEEYFPPTNMHNHTASGHLVDKDGNTSNLRAPVQ